MPDTRSLTPAEVAEAMAYAPDPQATPRIDEANRRIAAFALDSIRKEDVSDLLSAYLSRRFGRMGASIVLHDAARKADGGR